MSQFEVYEIIRKSKKPICKFQIAQQCCLSDVLLNISLKKLLKHKDIKCIELDRYESAKQTGRPVRRRMRFYYI
jgi:hypothetical protein